MTTRRLSRTRILLYIDNTIPPATVIEGRTAFHMLGTKTSSCSCHASPMEWCCSRMLDARSNVNHNHSKRTQRKVVRYQGEEWNARTQAVRRNRVARGGTICWILAYICSASFHHWGACDWAISSFPRRLRAKRTNQRRDLHLELY